MRASRLTPLLLAAVLATGAPARAAEPLVYAARTADYDVALRITPDLRRFPLAYARYRDRALKAITDFERVAEKGKAEQRRSGHAFPGPMIDRIEIGRSVITDHLAGFVERDYQDQQGAHPSPDIHAILLDRASQAELAPLDLLEPSSAIAPLNAALQAAVAAARTAREGGPPPGPGFSTPLWGAAEGKPYAEVGGPGHATLAPSAVSGRAGGLAFLYGPYDVGPYVDGAYRVVLPASLFMATLKPLYRDDFAPRPTGRPTSDPLAGFPTDLPR